MTAMLLPALMLSVAAPTGEIEAHPRWEPDPPSPFDGARNLFLGAKLEASPHWSDRKPEFAVDGRHDAPGNHWAAENIPVQLTVLLDAPVDLNAIRLWTYWDNQRYYQYRIEGSLDGNDWVLLVDQTANTVPQTAAGETFCFPTVRVNRVRVTFTHNSASNVAGGHIVEIEGYALPAESLDGLTDRTTAWREVPSGLHGAVGSVDRRYERDRPPALTGDSWHATAWRGERVAVPLLFWSREPLSQLRVSAGPLTDDAGHTIPASAVRLQWVRYVLADGRLVGDVLDPMRPLDFPAASTRPVWLSIEPPADQPPGRYRGEVVARAAGAEPVRIPVTIEVLPLTVPPAHDWSFWLDLWQNPYAIARYHHVEPWSPEHLALLEPHLRMLADAGQKCITTTILHQPWGTQTYDPYDSMVAWTRRADGSWAFDFSAFDTYVELAMRCGITRAINAYSILSWTQRVRYLDEASGEYRSLSFSPGADGYAELWRPFLIAFRDHLRAKGWLEIATLAMDERPLELMQPAVKLVEEVAPELRIALAGTYHDELKESVDDYRVFISGRVAPEIIAERSGRGQPTTFYVCCGPARPNTFVFSPPAESAWLGWYAAAKGYTGFLRWAYDSYVRDPLWDTSYVTWPAGDCFLVYPGPRSSVRFERLREGIVAYEKIHWLQAQRREGREFPSWPQLENALAALSYEAAQHTEAADALAPAVAALAAVSREAAR